MKNTLVSLFLVGGIASAHPSIDYQCRLGRYAKSGSTETEETLSMVWNGVRYQGGIQAKLLGKWLHLWADYEANDFRVRAAESNDIERPFAESRSAGIANAIDLLFSDGKGGFYFVHCLGT